MHSDACAGSEVAPPPAAALASGSDAQMRAEAFAFRKLVAHLQLRTDVQNIDLMNLSGFCRNCLSKWYAAANTAGPGEDALELAHQQVYGSASPL